MKILEDYKLNSFSSFLTLLRYRACNYSYINGGRVIGRLTNYLFEILYLLRNEVSQISYKAIIGRRIRLPHKGFGVVISRYAIVGDNVTLFHNVTLGINENKKDKKIMIGDDCYLSTGVTVISCEISEKTKVSPNVCVYKNLPPNIIHRG